MGGLQNQDKSLVGFFAGAKMGEGRGYAKVKREGRPWRDAEGCGGVASALSPNQRSQMHRSLTMGPISVQAAESQA